MLNNLCFLYTDAGYYSRWARGQGMSSSQTRGILLENKKKKKLSYRIVKWQSVNCSIHNNKILSPAHGRDSRLSLYDVGYWQNSQQYASCGLDQTHFIVRMFLRVVPSQYNHAFAEWFIIYVLQYKESLNEIWSLSSQIIS